MIEISQLEENHYIVHLRDNPSVLLGRFYSEEVAYQYVQVVKRNYPDYITALLEGHGNDYISDSDIVDVYIRARKLDKVVIHAPTIGKRMQISRDRLSTVMGFTRVAEAIYGLRYLRMSYKSLWDSLVRMKGIVVELPTAETAVIEWEDHSPKCMELHEDYLELFVHDPNL